MNEAARMSEIERKVESLEGRIDSSTVQVNESIKALTDNVNRLCERDIRADESKKYEDEWKSRIENNQIDQGKQIRSILDNRNIESQGRNFLTKNWPWLVVCVLLASGKVKGLI
ncbi:coil containing protein [Vibrio phage 1.054.O._10N.261.52.A1]|nr:coil containing protein [Vibrio phage 1.054.O._10N.261.52.A1]